MKDFRVGGMVRMIGSFFKNRPPGNPVPKPGLLGLNQKRQKVQTLQLNAFACFSKNLPVDSARGNQQGLEAGGQQQDQNSSYGLPVDSGRRALRCLQAI
jgi:hypothetical protein